MGLCAGIVEPIKSGIRDPRLGVGKQEEDDFFTAEENIQRKKLEVELEETEEHAKKREVLFKTPYLLFIVHESCSSIEVDVYILSNPHLVAEGSI